MKSKFSFSSLIRVAAITLVVSLMASLMTAAYAGHRGDECDDDVAGTWYGANDSEFVDPDQLATMQITKLKHGEKKIMIQMDQFNEAIEGGPQASKYQGEFHGDAEKVNDGVWHFTLKAHSRNFSPEGFVVLTGVIKHQEGCDDLFIKGTACVYGSLNDLHNGNCFGCQDFEGNYHRWQLQYNQNNCQAQ